MARWRVGADPGGTFAGACLFDEEQGRVQAWQVSPTPDDPSRGTALGAGAMPPLGAAPGGAGGLVARRRAGEIAA